MTEVIQNHPGWEAGLKCSWQGSKGNTGQLASSSHCPMMSPGWQRGQRVATPTGRDPDTGQGEQDRDHLGSHPPPKAQSAAPRLLASCLSPSRASCSVIISSVSFVHMCVVIQHIYIICTYFFLMCFFFPSIHSHSPITLHPSLWLHSLSHILYILSLSLSLSLTHTHTHTHTVSEHSDRYMGPAVN
jgi:hypothetical protein